MLVIAAFLIDPVRSLFEKEEPVNVWEEPYVEDEGVRPLPERLFPATDPPVRETIVELEPEQPIAEAEPPVVVSEPPPVAGVEPVAVEVVPEEEPAVASGPVAGLRTVLDRSLARLADETAAQRGERMREHRAALEILKEEMQKAGDLDGWTVATLAINTFENDGGMLGGGESPLPDKLVLLQADYGNAIREDAVAAARRMLAVVSSYRGRLKTMQKQLTVDGRMQEAMQVRDEITRVRSSAPVVAAELAVAEADRPDEPGESVVQISEPVRVSEAPPHVEAPPAELAPSLDEPLPRLVIARGTQPVPPETFTFMELAMKHVGSSARLRKVELNAVLGRDESIRTTSRKDSETALDSEEKSTRYMLRLAMRTGGAGKGLGTPDIWVQYFTKTARAGSRGDQFRQVTVERVNPGGMDREWVFVDMPPIEVRESTTTYRDAYYTRKMRTGETFAGVIVTIFDRRGAKALQVVSNSDLRRLASDRPWESGR